MKELTINLGEKTHLIYINRGQAKDDLEQADYIVTDTNVANKYKSLLKGKKVIIIKPGESSKSFENYKDLAKKLKDAEEITAFGGGVVGDLTGFVASTLRRGIPLKHVPTSLVAMIDSSIGGKNGINFEGRKNYFGTIYQPTFISIDLSLLNTLPKTEISNGVAEIIKYGAIKDPFLLERMQTKLSINDEDLEEIIASSIAVKRYFVEKDEHDKNIRHALNFGHTIGHALELEYGLSHGQAIAIGMIYESELLSLSDEKIWNIIAALEANGLPTKLPRGADIDKIVELMKVDKKGQFVFASDEDNYRTERTEEKIRDVLKRTIKKEKPSEELIPF